MPVELTFRGVCLGAVITIVFMSANVYLGLKTGITFASSIPAAVLSMGLLRLVGGGGALESNIVQTQASAAGTLCNINLVLPGLVLIRYWTHFPLWQTITLCLLGGLLGVAFSVPLRRVMVVESVLPFPEGVAAAEVLVCGRETDDPTHNENVGLRHLGIGAVAAGLFGMLTNGLKLLPDQIGGAFAIGHAAFQIEGGLSLALIGIGYLVRLGCCLALLVGIVISWGVIVPILTSGMVASDPRAAALMIWADKVRLVGAGLIAVAGLWTVASLFKPMAEVIWSGARDSQLQQSTEGDIPIAWIAVAISILLVPLAALLWNFVGAQSHIPPLLLIPALTVVTALLGFLMATACGYLAGLLGSSSSPISGIGVLTVMMIAALCLAVMPKATSDDARFIGALSIFVTALIITASSIANDNLQDLKAGQIVGATPWKQQIALAIGVVIGSITIAPVLQLLFSAYGFAGVLPRDGMNPAAALPAPQAALLAQIAAGIVGGTLDWTMVLIGAGLGIVFVGLENALRRRRGFTLPALSVGIGMYLPCSVVLTIAVGGVVGWLAERKIVNTDASHRTQLRRLGVLVASGFLVGESIVGIAIAISDVLRSKTNSLSMHVSVGLAEVILAVAIFVSIVVVFFYGISRQTR